MTEKVVEMIKSRFHRWFVVFMTSLAAVLILLVNASNTAPDLLQVPVDTIRLSAASGGLQQQTSIVLKNPCSQPISIVRVHTSCGCTVPGFETPFTVVPGGDVALPVTINLPKHGQKASRMQVIDDKGHQYDIAFLMTGIPRSIPSVISPPQNLSLASDEYGSWIEHQFFFETLESGTDSTPWVSGLLSSSNNLQASVQRVSEKDNHDGRSCTYCATIRRFLSQDPDENRPTALTIVDRNNTGTEVSVAHVGSHFSNDIYATPSDVVFSKSDSEFRRVVIRSRKRQLPDSFHIATFDPWISATVVERHSNAIVLEVGLNNAIIEQGSKNESVGRLARGTVQLTTQSPKAASVDVGVLLLE
jgi:hypothetical protein